MAAAAAANGQLSTGACRRRPRPRPRPLVSRLPINRRCAAPRPSPAGRLGVYRGGAVTRADEELHGADPPIGCPMIGDSVCRENQQMSDKAQRCDVKIA